MIKIAPFSKNSGLAALCVSLSPKELRKLAHGFWQPEKDILFRVANEKESGVIFVHQLGDMKIRTYLVATEQIITGNTTSYNPGQVFLVAQNDHAQGGYHARAIQQTVLEDEEDFEMDYEDEVPAAKGDDPSEYVFVPFFAVKEFKDAESAADFANEILDNEVIYI